MTAQLIGPGGEVALDAATLAALETITARIVDENGAAFTGANPLPVDAAGLTVAVDDSDRAFAQLLKFEPAVGDELRADDTATDRYHGAAPDGTATATAAWEVVRFYKDAAGAIVRVRYRTGVAWDDRTVGW